MSTARAKTGQPDTGSTSIGIAKAGRVTATVNSEEAVETGLFTATVTGAAAPQPGCAHVGETDEITATVTSGAHPASNAPTVTEFMSAVVAWPGSPTDPGFVNLHFSTVDRKNPTGPLRKGSGWPFRGVDTFVNRASWINTTTQFKDIWYCLSLQSQTKPNATDPQKPRAH